MTTMVTMHHPLNSGNWFVATNKTTMDVKKRQNTNTSVGKTDTFVRFGMTSPQEFQRIAEQIKALKGQMVVDEAPVQEVIRTIRQQTDEMQQAKSLIHLLEALSELIVLERDNEDIRHRVFDELTTLMRPKLLKPASRDEAARMLVEGLNYVNGDPVSILESMAEAGVPAYQAGPLYDYLIAPITQQNKVDIDPWGILPNLVEWLMYSPDPNLRLKPADEKQLLEAWAKFETEQFIPPSLTDVAGLGYLKAVEVWLQENSHSNSAYLQSALEAAELQGHIKVAETLKKKPYSNDTLDCFSDCLKHLNNLS